MPACVYAYVCVSYAFLLSALYNIKRECRASLKIKDLN